VKHLATGNSMLTLQLVFTANGEDLELKRVEGGGVQVSG
jgi:hypothetical protein